MPKSDLPLTFGMFAYEGDPAPVADVAAEDCPTHLCAAVPTDSRNVGAEGPSRDERALDDAAKDASSPSMIGLVVIGRGGERRADG